MNESLVVQKKHIFPYIGFMLMNLYYCINDTMFSVSFSEYFLLGSVTCYLIGYLIKGKFKLKYVLVATVFLGMYVYSYIFRHDSRILVYIITVISVIDINLKKLLKLIFFEKLIICFFTMVAGLGASGYTLGFIHENVFMLNVAELILLYICIYWKNMPPYAFAIILGIIFAAFYISDSRSGLVVLIIVYLLLLQVKFLPIKALKYMEITTFALSPVLFGLSILLPYILIQRIKTSSEILDLVVKINKLLTNRLVLSAHRLVSIDFHLFTSYVNEKASKIYGYQIIDSGYVDLLVVFGVLGSILFLVLYAVIIHNVNKLDYLGRGKYVLLLAICAISLYAFTEHIFCSLKYNFTLLFILLYQKNRKTKGD